MVAHLFLGAAFWFYTLLRTIGAARHIHAIPVSPIRIDPGRYQVLAANERIYLSLRNGSIVCYAE